MEGEGFRILAAGQAVEYARSVGDDGRARAVAVSAPGGQPLQPQPAEQRPAAPQLVRPGSKTDTQKQHTRAQDTQ